MDYFTPIDTQPDNSLPASIETLDDRDWDDERGYIDHICSIHSADILSSFLLQAGHVQFRQGDCFFQYVGCEDEIYVTHITELWRRKASTAELATACVYFDLV